MITLNKILMDVCLGLGFKAVLERKGMFRISFSLERCTARLRILYQKMQLKKNYLQEYVTFFYCNTFL